MKLQARNGFISPCVAAMTTRTVPGGGTTTHEDSYPEHLWRVSRDIALSPHSSPSPVHHLTGSWILWAEIKTKNQNVRCNTASKPFSPGEGAGVTLERWFLCLAVSVRPSRRTPAQWRPAGWGWLS